MGSEGEWSLQGRTGSYMGLGIGPYLPSVPADGPALHTQPLVVQGISGKVFIGISVGRPCWSIMQLTLPSMMAHVENVERSKWSLEPRFRIRNSKDLTKLLGPDLFSQIPL